MSALAQRWQQVRDWVAGRTRRERGLLLITLLVALGLPWFTLHFEPLREETAERWAERAEATRSAQALEREIAVLKAELERDPDDRIAEEITGLSDDVAALEAEIEERAPDFVDPGEMRRVVERLLHEQQGARLIAIESQPPETLVEAEDGEAAIYRHGLRVVFDADFAGALRYLEAVENLPWRLAWRSMDYRVQAHPRARIEIRIETLSGQLEWIGT